MTQNQNVIITIALGIVIIGAVGVLAYTSFFPPDNSGNEETDTNDIILTVFYQEMNYNYTLSDLETLPSSSGTGRYIKTKLLPDQVVLGDSYQYTGIPIPTLLDDIGIDDESYYVNITASDGWTNTFTKNETQGFVDIYNESGNVTRQGTVTMILAYKENGQYYTEIDPNEEIGPLRVAFVSEHTPITSSNLWVKMVTEIDVITDQ